MPWIAASGNSYRLSLLDTNGISEIVKRPTIEGRGFIERYPPDAYVPCFTPYNLFELRRHAEVYDKFLDFFSVYPCFLTKPHQFILEAELTATGPLPIETILLYAFSPVGADKSRNLRCFVERLFEKPEIAQEERQWRAKEQSILAAWLKNSKNFQPRRSAGNSLDADRYVKMATIDTLCSIAPAWIKSHLDRGTLPDIAKLPSLQIMLYSQYYRIFSPGLKLSQQDVTDIRIMACAPYVDAIVTETFQAEILNKVRKRVTGLNSVEITRLRDIRPTTA